MAKDKDRALNPAAAQRKADKQKALKKGKAHVAAQRTERLAARNPRRLESQIADLHALKESQGGKLSARDQKQLEEAEWDIQRVKKARETLGDKAPAFGARRDERGRGGVNRGSGKGGGYTGLGKRTRDSRDGEGEGNSGSETDESVRKIPWPRDTPPPMPRFNQNHGNPRYNNNANEEPLGTARQFAPVNAQTDQHGAPDTSLPSKPPASITATSTARTTYESAPQVRDLRKEATKAFVPGAVRRKIDAKRGKGGRLLEEEDMMRLEEEGYGARIESETGTGIPVGKARDVRVDAAPEVDSGGGLAYLEERERERLEEEEERFRAEMAMETKAAEEGVVGEGVISSRGGSNAVRMEDVSDEDL